MRLRIPDRNFPTESRRTVSKTHSAFNDLLRRLATRTDSSFFGGAQARAEVSKTLRRHGPRVISLGSIKTEALNRGSSSMHRVRPEEATLGYVPNPLWIPVLPGVLTYSL